MRYPWANTILLVLVLVLLATGIGGLISGSEQLRGLLWLHSVASYGVVAVLGWKAMIIVYSFRRRRQLSLSRLMFVVLTVLLLLTLATGYWWTTYGATYAGGRSVLTWHGFLAIAVFALLLWHVLARRWVLRVNAAHDRRTFLRFVGLGVVGLVLERFIEPAKAHIALAGAQRRFTGSYETGSFTGNFPPTIWLFDDPQPIAVEDWLLSIDGAVDHPMTLTYAQVLELANTSSTALIDCTGGWYSTQAWTGVLLARLLDMAGVKTSARSVTLRGVTGYHRAFELAEARSYLLATHVAGQPLDHGHGFPLRLVAPGHRGFDWVKWVTHIEVSETSHLLQPPVPLQ
jgi:hypothetical protein